MPVPEDSALRRFLAARLVEARKLQGVSQRSLGDRMGLGKMTGATRINRYERGTKSISLASLEPLAHALDVPAAFLLAESAAMAEAIHSFSLIHESQQPTLARALDMMTRDPRFLSLVLGITKLSREEWNAAQPALEKLLKPGPSG
jgi:transcriptional regulator with XRE-family HTH domain